jgi:hypothetical protein
MNRGRFRPATAVLPSGKWLVAGGMDIVSGGHTAELYEAGVWTMQQPRGHATAVGDGGEHQAPPPGTLRRPGCQLGLLGLV